MIQKHTVLTALVLICIPQTAFAYLNPEDVLLNRELYLPPTARESQLRTSLQAEEAAARREREQEAAFSLQRPKVEEEPATHQSAPEQPQQNIFYAVPVQGGNFYPAPGGLGGGSSTNLDAANMELLRTMRLLSRVNSNQALQHPSAGAAPYASVPLAGTGAGGILSAITMIGAIGWTLRRAKRAPKAALC